MNGRRYGRSSRSSKKISSGNVKQSLHLAPPPSATTSVTLTFPPLLTTPRPLFPALPIPTPILTLQTTSTTPTTTSISPLSHPSYPPNNYVLKRQKTLLAPHPQPPPQQPQAPRSSTHPYLPSCPKNPVLKEQNNLPRSPSQRETQLRLFCSFSPTSD